MKKHKFFLYGWIAGGWEAHFHNYRHFVSQCPVSTLDWLPNFPHKVWVDPGEGLFTCQVNHRERESNRDHLCSNRSSWSLYRLLGCVLLSFGNIVLILFWKVCSTLSNLFSLSKHYPFSVEKTFFVLLKNFCE